MTRGEGYVADSIDWPSVIGVLLERNAAARCHACAAAADANDSVRINQIQVIGTHNSYHAGLAPSEAKLLEQKNPKLYQALEYRHQPLD